MRLCYRTPIIKNWGISLKNRKGLKVVFTDTKCICLG